MEFFIKGPSNFFGCFGVSEKKNPDYYYLQNKKTIKFEHMKNEIDFSDKYKEEIDIKKNCDDNSFNYSASLNKLSEAKQKYYDSINNELLSIDDNKDIIDCCNGFKIINEPRFEVCMSFILSANNLSIIFES